MQELNVYTFDWVGLQDVTLGTFTLASSTYGWNQGGAGVNAATAGNTVQDTGAGGFKDLQDDVQAMCAFLGRKSVRTGVGSDVSTSDTILASNLEQLTMLNIKDCWDTIDLDQQVEQRQQTVAQQEQQHGLTH